MEPARVQPGLETPFIESLIYAIIRSQVGLRCGGPVCFINLTVIGLSMRQLGLRTAGCAVGFAL